MSLRLMGMAWDNDGIPQSAKLAMLALCDSADDTTRECFPSIKTLCKKASVSKATLSYIFRSFEAIGNIKREQRFKKNGANSSTIYTILNPVINKDDYKKAYQKAKGYTPKQEEETPQSEQAKHPKVNTAETPQSEQGETPQSEQATIINPHGSINPLKNKQKDSDSFSDQVEEIITHLNEILGTNYRPKSEETRKLIKARINEGFTVDDFKKVHIIKFAEWSGTDMEVYLRPSTLYRPKFEQYLNQKISEYNMSRAVSKKTNKSSVQMLRERGLAS